MSIGFANIFEIFQKNFSKSFDKQMTACPLCHVGMPFDTAVAVGPGVPWVWWVRCVRGVAVRVPGVGHGAPMGEDGTVGGGELVV